MERSLDRRGGFAEQVARTWRTVRHIPATNLSARARSRTLARLYALAPRAPLAAARLAARGTTEAPSLPRLDVALVAPEGAEQIARRARALARGCFDYLGREIHYPGDIEWGDRRASPLWLFHLHYLGSVLDLVLAGERVPAQRVLESWSNRFAARWDAIAWHPYPLSLRLINLGIAAAHLRSFERLGSGALDLTAIHAAHLLHHLEDDLRGNHLLENALALLFAGRCLAGPLAHRCDRTARSIYAREIPEQILPDGGHFELSPMYHTIVLHRLLLAMAILPPGDSLAGDLLEPAVRSMSRFLAGILCPDGDIPLIGDSARGFAPPPRSVLALARRAVGVETRGPTLGLESFHSTGLHVFRGRRWWAIFDTGPVCPPYLPGHGQADSLTVEIWCDGVCVITDPGVYEYSGPERAWGRSSRAHSTITLDDANSSEVYGSFRVGGRASVDARCIAGNEVRAAIRPFGGNARLSRRIALRADARETLEIFDRAEDALAATALSRLHLAPGVRVIGDDGSATAIRLELPGGTRIRLTSAHGLHHEPGRRSPRFGTIEPTTILVQPLQPTRAREQQGWFHLEART